MMPRVPRYWRAELEGVDPPEMLLPESMREAPTGTLEMELAGETVPDEEPEEQQSALPPQERPDLLPPPNSEELDRLASKLEEAEEAPRNIRTPEMEAYEARVEQAAPDKEKPPEKTRQMLVIPEGMESRPDCDAGSANHQEAFGLDFLKERRIAHTFTVIIAKIAEDLGGWPTDGDDEWDVDALMRRRMTLQNLSRCRRSREKESVVLILDTSGSCLPQARFYSRIAGASLGSGDIDLYIAPNAGLHARRSRNGWDPVDSTDWKFSGRTIIFFGDFDGGDAVVEASWRNTVYWFCSEGNRYPTMKAHPWCSYTIKEFRGKFFECNSENDFLRLIKKVR